MPDLLDLLQLASTPTPWSRRGSGGLWWSTQLRSCKRGVLGARDRPPAIVDKSHGVGDLAREEEGQPHAT